jgi:hypothetical protein
VHRSIVVFGNSKLTGSRANYDGIQCRLVYPPGDAISGDNGVLFLGAGTELRAGSLNIFGGTCPPISIQGASIRGVNIEVLRDPGVTLVGPTIGSVTVTTHALPTLDGVVADTFNGRMDFDLIAAPSAAMATFASMPTTPLLSPFGIQWIDLGAYLVTDVSLTDNLGHRRTSMTLPLAYPLGWPMVFQSVVLDPAGLRWSTPSIIVRN